jgi:uncharacterized protein
MGAVRNFRIRGGAPKVRQCIENLCEQIVRVADPLQIILFGSYAYGNPTEDSDIDLLVIMPFDVSPHAQAVKIKLQIDTPMRLDLLVRTPEQVRQRIEMGDLFMQEIVERGKMLYSQSDSYSISIYPSNSRARRFSCYIPILTIVAR